MLAYYCTITVNMTWMFLIKRVCNEKKTNSKCLYLVLCYYIWHVSFNHQYPVNQSKLYTVVVFKIYCELVQTCYFNSKRWIGLMWWMIAGVMARDRNSLLYAVSTYLIRKMTDEPLIAHKKTPCRPIFLNQRWNDRLVNQFFYQQMKASQTIWKTDHWLCVSWSKIGKHPLVRASEIWAFAAFLKSQYIAVLSGYLLYVV